MVWLVVHGILIDFYTSMWKFWTLLVRFFSRMTDFINFKAEDDGEVDVVVDDWNPEAQTVSDNEFIDGKTQIDENIEDYYLLMYVEVEVLRMQCKILFSKWIAVNLCSSMRWIIIVMIISEQISEFRDSAKWIEEFKHTLLCPHSLKNQDSFYYAILYAIRYHLKNKKGECQNEDQLKENLGNLCITSLNLKENWRVDLDIQNFENQCYSVEKLSDKNRLFLRVYELKEKFRYLIKQNPEKKIVLRGLSSCVIKKFNSFNVVHVELNKKLRKPFRPIHIIYKPAKKCDDILDCFLAKT